MSYTILFYPLATLFIISLMAGPIGAFMVWKRISFFSDSLAHASILGGVIAFILKINPSIGLIPISIIFALLTFIMRQKMPLRSDLSISLLASFFMAISLFVAKVSGISFHIIESLLFGDILMVGSIDFYEILVSFAVLMTWVIIRWKDIFKLILSEDIAISEGINTKRLSLEVLIVMAGFISKAMKIMGVMLLTANLIIPASIAIMLFTSPLKILIGSAITGLIISLISVGFAYNFDQSISVLSVMTGFALLNVVYIISARK